MWLYYKNFGPMSTKTSMLVYKHKKDNTDHSTQYYLWI